MGVPAAASLRCDVLGPLRIWRGGEAVSVVTQPQRTALSVLALHANRPIKRDQLIEAIWGATAPAYAVNLVQKRMSELRTLLDPGHSPGKPSQILRWTDRGYVFALPQDGLDLWHHSRQIAQARAERARGDLHASVRSLNTALQLWRGTPFDGLTSPLLEAERARLVDARLTAVEERVELEIALGAGGAVISELRQLVDHNPLREHLRELLMIALDRAGRRADALAEYQAARRHLRDELGIDPCRALEDLHQRILRADSELHDPSSASIHRGDGMSIDWRVTPAELPHGLPTFVAREAEIRRLDSFVADDAFADAMGLIVIAGTAGVGKSALAVTWAHRVRELFPDGQLYVNLRGYDPAEAAVDPADAVRGFLAALSPRPRGIPVHLDAQAALYRSLLAGRRMLVILDNARSAEQIRPLLPGTPGCAVIITSRNQLAGLVATDGAHTIDLDLLDTDEARQLLAKRLGAERVASEPLAVDTMINACARLPLALTIAAARARPLVSLASVAADLMEAKAGLDAFSGDDAMSDIRRVISWSYVRLSAPAQRAFRLLGALSLGPELSPPAIGSVVGLDQRGARSLIAELTDASLLVERLPGRLAMHDLLRAYALELATAVDAVDSRRDAAVRMIDFYLHAAYAADRVVAPHREDLITIGRPSAGVTLPVFADHASALAWFGEEHAGLLAAIRRGVELGLDEHVWQLSWALTHHFEFRALLHDSIAAYDIGLAATRRLGDKRAEALIRKLASRPCARLGRFAEADAHLDAALAYFEGAGDVPAQAHAHRVISIALDGKGMYGQGIAHAQRARSLYAAVGMRTGEGRALNGVGWLHALSGDHRHGLAYCEEALALQQQVGDRSGEADTYDSIGYVQRRAGRHERSAEAYRRARSIYQQLGNRWCEAESTIAFGDARAAAGDRIGAHSTWRVALELFEDLAHPDTEKVRSRLG